MKTLGKGTIEKLESISNDFAIIRLKEKVNLTEKISLIQLPKEGAECPPGEMPFVISGWGRDRPKHPNVPFDLVPATRFLQAVKQECFDVKKCLSIYKDDPDRAWCIGDSNNFQNGQCSGDSGGKWRLSSTSVGLEFTCFY